MTDKGGAVSKVDKRWTFLKAAAGNVRIMAHHSLLPPPSPCPSTSFVQAPLPGETVIFGTINFTAFTYLTLIGSHTTPHPPFAAASTPEELHLPWGPVHFYPATFQICAVHRAARAGTLDGVRAGVGGFQKRPTPKPPLGGGQKCGVSLTAFSRAPTPRARLDEYYFACGPPGQPDECLFARAGPLTGQMTAFLRTCPPPPPAG